MTICVVDTSVLCELLGVPGRNARHADALAELEQKLAAREQLLMPLAAIIETGNHIAHVSDGFGRRSAAGRFVELVRPAIAGDSPFTPTPMPDLATVGGWLDLFVDDATAEIGIADRSILAVWEAQRTQHAASKRRVYVWSYDAHLSGYDTG